MSDAAPAIVLEPLSSQNREALIRLSVAPHQTSFVASNAASIEQAAITASAVPFAIRRGEEIVGFAMYALDPDDGEYWIWRMMVDASLQRQGIGRTALLQLVALMSALPDCTRIRIGVVPGNDAAAALYASVGFAMTGQIIEGERLMELSLRTG